jgi:hypothetical protein
MHTATPLNRIANKGGVQRFKNDAPAAAARVVEMIPLEQRIRATAPIEISQIVSPCRDCGPLNSCSVQCSCYQRQKPWRPDFQLKNRCDSPAGGSGSVNSTR